MAPCNKANDHAVTNQKYSGVKVGKGEGKQAAGCGVDIEWALTGPVADSQCQTANSKTIEK